MVDKEKFRKIEQGRNKNQTCLEIYCTNKKLFTCLEKS